MNNRLQGSSVQTMSVDIRLCGNIPRKDMMENQLHSQPCLLRALTSCQTSDTLNESCLAGRNAQDNGDSTHNTIPFCDKVMETDSLSNNNTQSNMRDTMQDTPFAPLFEISAPKWAVPARKFSQLEPVCESLGRQRAVDLTKSASFRIGRSPNSDIQLMHATSSRRHAMVFHHANGTCYIVDCGSAHGTYVNGTRIASPVRGSAVVPYKVRRGAMIRFGGPGAPCFVLKSFNFQLSDITSHLTAISDTGELIRRNTRINALGKSAGEILGARIASTIEEGLSVCRKRSFDSIESQDSFPGGENAFCKRRCMSPPLSPEAPLRLVSPDLSTSSRRRRVTFSEDPPQTFYPCLVTPDELSSDEDYA